MKMPTRGAAYQVSCILIALTAWLALPARAEPKRGAPTAALRFTWPAKLEADVEYRRSRVDSLRPDKNSSVAFTGRLTAVTQGDEVRVTYTGWNGDAGANPVTGPLLRASEQLVTISDLRGAFRRLEGTAAAENALAEAVKQLPGIEKLPPETLEQLMKFAPAGFEREARDTWTSMVSVWAGNDLEIGADYEMEGGAAPVPALPGEKIRMDARLRAVRFVDCPGAPRTRCVELWLRSEPNAEDVDRLVKALVSKLGLTNAASALSDLSMIVEVSVVTEPARLVPHLLEMKRTTKLAAGTGGEKTRLERVDTTSYTYRYRR